MSDAVSEAEKPPIFKTAGLLVAVTLLVVAFLVLLQWAWFDVPIHMPIDLEHKGVPAGRDWLVRNFEAEEKRAWAELSPTVDIAITDSFGAIRMREVSRLSGENGWTMTNGSEEDRPASVYKFITFTPVTGERYQIRVSVVKGCAGANALSPVFFIDLPTAVP